MEDLLSMGPTPSSFVQLLMFMVCGNIFKVLSIPNHKSWGAEILRECSPPTMCHMSRVICQVSGVSCQVSGVKCQVSGVIIFIFFLQSGGACRWRACYQWGLPRLVFLFSD